MKKHLVDTDANILVHEWNPTSLDNVKDTLLDGYNILKQHNAGIFRHFLSFGKVLNNSFDYFSIGKLKGAVPHDLTWAKWLEDNVGISICYSKQLRSIARDFGKYKTLNFLGISFSKFLKRKEHIRLMFTEFPELAEFWQNITTFQT